MYVGLSVFGIGRYRRGIRHRDSVRLMRQMKEKAIFALAG